MAKRLSFYISLISAVVFIIVTSIYYYQTKNIFFQEIYARGQIIVQENKKSISNFFYNLRNISYTIYQDESIKKYLLGHKEIQNTLEKRFLEIQKNVRTIQAIRILDSQGNIVVFVKERIILSSKENYKPISLINKKFVEDAMVVDNGYTLLTNFERGKLPNDKNFCPSMIRTITPYYHKSVLIGFLVVNFWGNSIESKICKLFKNDKGISFLIEFNNNDKERDGIFVFHKNKKYEFANQFGTQYRFSNVYNTKISDFIRNNESGNLKLPDSNSHLIFSTIYPYENRDQLFKIATILHSDYIYKNLDVLKKNLFYTMIFAIIISIITGIAFSRRIVKPFDKIKESLNHYGQGELDYNFKIEGDFQVREIADNIQNMATSLKKYIQELSISRKNLEKMDRIYSLAILSAGLSHELNTPLNSIILLSKMLYNDSEETKKDDLIIIKEQAERCVRILDNLKSLTPFWRIGNDSNNTNLKETILKLKPLFELTGKKANIFYDLDDCSINVNQVHFEQIILNLVLNALDACDDNGSIKIVLRNKDNEVMLKIIDNGTGISQEMLPMICDPFFSTKLPHKGMGLGLSIVKNLISQYNGTLDFSQNIENGVTVTVSFKDHKYENYAYRG